MVKLIFNYYTFQKIVRYLILCRHIIIVNKISLIELIFNYNRQKHTSHPFAGAINSTARKIKIQRMQPPKPPTLRDLLPSGIRNTLYDTENQFEVELLTGMSKNYTQTPASSI